MASTNFTFHDLELLENPEHSGEAFDRFMRVLTDGRGVSVLVASLEAEGAVLSTIEKRALAWAHRGLNTRAIDPVPMLREWDHATRGVQWEALTGRELTLVTLADDCLEACLRD